MATAGPALVGLVSWFLAWLVAAQYRLRRRPFRALGAVALFLMGLQSWTLAAGTLLGWPLPVYEGHYLLTALSVGTAGVATIYLVGRRAGAGVFATIVTAAAAALVVSLVKTPVDQTVVATLGAAASGAVSVVPRVLRASILVLAALAIGVGAVWSFALTHRGWNLLAIPAFVLLAWAGWAGIGGHPLRQLGLQLLGLLCWALTFLGGRDASRLTPRPPAADA